MSGNSQSISDLVTQWVRSEVRELSAYHVPDASDMVKLDAMENPYPWPESISDSWLALLEEAQINRYPDPAAQTLKRSLRSAFEIPEHCDVLLGNGSDEIIQMLAMAVAKPGRVVLSVEPSFVMYKMIALMVGMEYVGVPLNQDFSVDIDATVAAIKEHNPALIFLAYPNNPTGNLFSEEAVQAIVEAASGLVVIDEAYYAFAGTSLLDWISKYNNVLVMRTVSKMGMAGLRLGYLIGDCQWLEQVDKMRLPYNIGVLTQLTAQIALENVDAFDRQTRKICQDRQLLFQAMKQIEGIDVFESAANFILFRVQHLSSRDVFEQLKKYGVLIKNLGDNTGPLQSCLRVTVGTAEENERFVQSLRKILIELG